MSGLISQVPDWSMRKETNAFVACLVSLLHRSVPSAYSVGLSVGLLRRPAPSAYSVGLPVGLLRRSARRPTPSACSVDPFPLASSCSLLNGPTREPQAASTESDAFLYIASGTQPAHSLFSLSAHSLAMHSFLSRRPQSAFRCPAAAVAVPGPQLLRIALIDRASCLH